jgi:arylsulfatase A-like enzyme
MRRCCLRFPLAYAFAVVGFLFGPACSTVDAEPRAPKQPPNVLLLFADDLRRDAIGCFGGQAVFTPHLDALAARGTRLTRAYCMGSRHGAVCVASRAMLLTGRALPHVQDDMAPAVTLPELLREHGYATFMTGKWHNGDASLTRAFPEATAVFRGGMSDHFHVPLADVRGGAITNERQGDRHSSELFADAAITFLRERARTSDRPFLAYVPFTAPHDPRDPPQHWLERLSTLLPPPALPANFRPQHGLNLGKQTMTVRDENLLGWPREPELLRDQLREYRALVSHLDEQVGRILDALDETGLAGDTLVVFASDHGLALGRHGLLGKQSVYEHSMGSPVIVAGPGVPRGAVRGDFAYLFDLMPTMLRAAGVPCPDVDGRDLTETIREGLPGRSEIVLAFATTQRAIRIGDDKLIRLPQIDRTLLFDLGADPDELRDLAGDPEHAAVREELEQRLRESLEELGDEAPWTAGEIEPPTIDLTGRRFPPDGWQPAWIVRKYWPESFWPTAGGR